MAGTWADITPMARRDWILWITSAKQNETRLIRMKKSLLHARHRKAPSLLLRRPELAHQRSSLRRNVAPAPDLKTPVTLIVATDGRRFTFKRTIRNAKVRTSFRRLLRFFTKPFP